MSKNKIILIAGAIIVLGIVLVLSTNSPASSQELTLDKLVEDQEKYADDNVTVEGLLDEQSVNWNADEVQLKFTVKSTSGEQLHVTYNNVKPDNFSEGITTIIQGKPTGKNNEFIAESVQTRCPSKYEGEDTSNYDPETHSQKDTSISN